MSRNKCSPCRNDIQISENKFRCSACGTVHDVTEPVFDGLVSSVASAIDTGRPQL